MAKLAFSVFAALVALGTSASAFSIPRQISDSDSGSPLTNVSVPTVASCDPLCAAASNVLVQSCEAAGVANPNGELLVPCGCTEEFVSAQQDCSRCILSFSATGTILENGIVAQSQIFAEFQGECAAAGSAIPSIDLTVVELTSTIARPITFTFETPLSIYDEFFPNYIAAVCIRPDQITPDQCFIGGVNWARCPNPDVSGILVRVSAYLANLLLGIILMYSPKEASTAVWTQLLTVYSLLVSGMIAITGASLSRFHSGMTIFLVMSPLSSTLVVYSILGFCGRSHRLDVILSKRREHLIPRLLVLAFAAISLALVIYTGAANVHHFSTAVCETDDFYKTVSGVLTNLLFIPYAGVVVVLLSLVEDTKDLTPADLLVILSLMLPIFLLAGSFVYAVVKQRRMLAQRFRVESGRWKIWVVWDVLAVQYPLIHFCGVFFVPMLYWVLVNELRTVGTPDNLFSVSFGQVLAMFVILPPLLQVIQLAPEARGWFLNLTFTRFVTGRRDDDPTSSTDAHSLEDGFSEKFNVDPFQEPTVRHRV
ncbi:hypothetical protein C8R46DRAFT_1010115 [Mycena filopes]|nr:hypothetical protein C8R46DRAFT_1010115 [Mycena filopes]